MPEPLKLTPPPVRSDAPERWLAKFATPRARAQRASMLHQVARLLVGWSLAPKGATRIGARSLKLDVARVPWADVTPEHVAHVRDQLLASGRFTRKSVGDMMTSLKAVLFQTGALSLAHVEAARVDGRADDVGRSIVGMDEDEPEAVEAEEPVPVARLDVHEVTRAEWRAFRRWQRARAQRAAAGLPASRTPEPAPAAPTPAARSVEPPASLQVAPTPPTSTPEPEDPEAAWVALQARRSRGSRMVEQLAVPEVDTDAAAMRRLAARRAARTR